MCNRADEDCKECGGTGKLTFDSCPRSIVPRDIWEVLTYCDYMEKGMLPHAGGVLEQTRWFIDAAAFVSSENERLKPPSLTL